jgi:hypothetical protein
MIEVADSIKTFPLSAIKTDNAQPDEQIFVLSGSQLQNLQEALDSLLVRIDILESKNRALKSKLEILEQDQAYQAENQFIQLRLINELRKMPESKGASYLVDELYNHMKSVGLKQTTFTGAAKILEVTRQRTQQLKSAIALDTRFILMPSENHKQRLLIRLKGYSKL